jgi:hypothetical protein
MESCEPSHRLRNLLAVRESVKQFSERTHFPFHHCTKCRFQQRNKGFSLATNTFFPHDQVSKLHRRHGVGLSFVTNFVRSAARGRFRSSCVM